MGGGHRRICLQATRRSAHRSPTPAASEIAGKVRRSRQGAPKNDIYPRHAAVRCRSADRRMSPASAGSSTVRDIRRSLPASRDHRRAPVRCPWMTAASRPSDRRHGRMTNSVPGLRSRDRLSNAGVVGYVGSDEHTADAGGHGLATFGVEVEDRDLGTMVREHCRRRATEPRRAAGYDRRTGQIHIALPLARQKRFRSDRRSSSGPKTRWSHRHPVRNGT